MTPLLDLSSATALRVAGVDVTALRIADADVWEAPDSDITEHSIFGPAVPATLASYNDGVTNYWTGQQFYTLDTFPAGLITKGRILIPAGSIHIGQPFSMALSKPEPGAGILLPEQSPVALDSGFALNGSKADGTLIEGWNEIPFTGGPYLLNPGDGFLVGALINGGSGYLYNADLGVSYFESPTVPGFRLAERNRRCEYNGSWSAADWYGLDVVIETA